MTHKQGFDPLTAGHEMGHAGPAVDVVVPTFRRPESLRRCCAALLAQSVPPRQVIVAVQAGDAESIAMARASVPGEHLSLTETTAPGVIAAMSAGVAASSAPIVAFTDDDAIPRQNWLEQIAGWLSEDGVGAVGGRDVVVGDEGPLTERVGVFAASGRFIGNHHLGFGEAREVDALKGVNMAFRVAALALPMPGILRGDGAEVDFELLVCGWVRRAGWRVVYDPAILVDHAPGPRRGDDQRGRPAERAVESAAFNTVVASSVAAPRGRLRRLLYPLLIGSTERPGPVRGVVALLRGETDVLARLRPALRGKAAAIPTASTLWRCPSEGVVTAAALRGDRT